MKNFIKFVSDTDESAGGNKQNFNIMFHDDMDGDKRRLTTEA